MEPEKADQIGNQEEIDAILRELCGPDSHHTVQIFRWSDSRNRYAYVRRQAAPEFTLDWIQQTYGGGKYNFRVMDGAGRHFKSVVYCIEDLPKDPAAGGNGVGKGDADPVRELLAAVVKQNEQILQLLAAGASSQQTKDPIETALRIVEVMRPMHNPPATSAVKDMLDVFREGIELGALSSGGDSVLPIVERLGKPLIDLLTRQQEIDASIKALPAKVKLDAGAPARISDGGVSPAQPSASVSPGAPSLLDQVRVSIGQLIPLAQAGREPSVYSVVFLDQLPEELYQELLGLSQREDFTTFILSQFPETKPHEAWFFEFLSALKEQLGGQDEDTEPTAA